METTQQSFILKKPLKRKSTEDIITRVSIFNAIFYVQDFPVICLGVQKKLPSAKYITPMIIN